MSIDLTKIRKVYFIGIKGVAMSGLAVICKQRGLDVAGSDVSEKFITDKILTKQNILVFDDFSAKNLEWGPDLVVIGASWNEENPDVKEVKSRNILNISESELRGLLSQERETIAVTGVHGKTTTTALLSYLFTKANLNPSFLIGTGNIPDLGGNSKWSDGNHFIVEGDEYVRNQKQRTPKFLDLDPKISIITSVEWEHVDVYEDLAAIENAFLQLINKTKDLVVVCGDWPSIKKIIKGQERKVVTYGLEKGNLWQAYGVREEFNQTVFKVKKEEIEFGEFSLSLFGFHNVLNALACIIVCLKVGIELEQIRDSLKNFSGAERRFDISEREGIIFVDDYAHHPSEIKTTLKAVRHRYPNQQIYCVFQPHMASRTKALLKEFAKSFSDVNKVIFADIFASAREKVEDITSKTLTEETKKNHPDVVYGGDLNQAIEYLQDKIKDGMVLITMGAGDVYRVRDKLIDKIEQK
ncbi:MAG: UDP-N-acetylmuramate--L-alanine ligase [Candidatus Buchananbacteria bacterium RIFCSPHIGHO2_02_FULL_38_8]|uniref:UDP-N-acetylmuramate--L-alanine ligase n=1 Tax=Candidatus Buchananbacteria bacterium RIFCSPHIGHO2_02_FULL_38_8 TaxID=1797538 RepID=A0A1G1Y6C5_9BACT|nr:MAG: UDP-N-acetylmuramate--L-alanine ligase [Candidatus Buchananbacteria bacterium RIFCSPHIGHO2_02_FULL_38_8]